MVKTLLMNINYAMVRLFSKRLIWLAELQKSLRKQENQLMGYLAPVDAFSVVININEPRRNGILYRMF